MRAWTIQELRVLRTFAPLGKDAVAQILERTAESVKHKAAELRISLEVTGEDIDVTATAKHYLDRVRETPKLSVCPLCGKRLANMRTSEMCRVCHLDRLLDLHRERMDEELRQKRLAKARQDRHRMRVCDRCNGPFFPSSASKATKCMDCEDR